MRISGEQGKGGRNRCVSSRASAGGYTKVRADRTRLCSVSTRDLCRYTVPCQVAWFLWAPHALAAFCNRHVRHAISWLCWLKTTEHNLGNSQKIMYQFSHPAVECGRNTWGGIHDVRDAPPSFEKPSWQRERRLHTLCRATARWGARLSRSWCQPSARPCRRSPVMSHSSVLRGSPSSVRWGCICYGMEDNRLR